MKLWHLLCIVAALGAPSSLAAHPHLWIDATVDLQLDHAGVRAVTVSWIFDEFNSADMIFSFDENRDGRFSEREQTTIRENAFSHLIDSDYFIVAYQGSEKLDIQEVESFRAAVTEGRLLYEFSVPLRVPWRRIDNLVVGAFDESYFIDFVSEPASGRYDFRGRTVHVENDEIRLESEGWGTIRVPAIRAELQ